MPGSAPKRRRGAAGAAAAAAAPPAEAAPNASGSWRELLPPRNAKAGLLDAALVLVFVWAFVYGRPTSPLAVERVGELLRGADFQAAYEVTYLHLPGAVDVGVLAGAETRLFARLDGRSAPSVLVYRDGEPWQPPVPVVDAASAAAALADGATVVVNSAQGADSALEAMALSVTAAVGVYADVNLYVTPPDAAGLHAHHDQMDSVVVQGSGSKVWLMCDPVGIGLTLPTKSSDDPRHPLYNRYDAKALQEVPGNGCRNVTLVAGDLLYLPRGVPHAPFTEPDPIGPDAGRNSVHWTIGLLGDFIWEDYLKGLTIATPSALDPSELPTVIDCVDPRGINQLVPHAVLQSARSYGGTGRVLTEELDALAEAFAKGFEELAWRGGCASRLRASLIACGVSCAGEVRAHKAILTATCVAAYGSCYERWVPLSRSKIDGFHTKADGLHTSNADRRWGR